MMYLGFVLGLLLHALKQLRTAKAVGNPTTLRSYVFGNWNETLTAVVSGVIFLLGFQEICVLFPDAAKIFSMGNGSLLYGAMCGGLGNSLADVIGDRVKKLFGGP